jgi:UDP-glucose 4-epimerase
VRVAVTGGAGFIGSHTVELLLAQGHDVLVIDNLATGSRANLAAAVEPPEFADLDLRDLRGCRGLLARWQPDAVLHLAAVASVPRSISEPALVHDVNLNGTLSALEAARRCGVRRFVFAGSAAVYGLDPPLPAGELDPVVPGSPYAAQKAAAELLLRGYRATWGIETVVLRLFNVFGERQRPDSGYSGVISIFAEALRRHGYATISGDGEQTRDFIHVRDAARALSAAVTVPDPGPEPINVARGAALSIRELYRLIAGRLELPDEPRFGPERVGDVRHSLARVERMHEALGVIPVVTIEQGLDRLLRWLAGVD